MYILNDVKTVTTKVDRCFQSAALLLAGLYPPKGHQIWNQKLRWQPVPISSESPDKVYVGNWLAPIVENVFRMCRGFIFL